jgi:hypothetical protein
MALPPPHTFFTLLNSIRSNVASPGRPKHRKRARKWYLTVRFSHTAETHTHTKPAHTQNLPTHKTCPTQTHTHTISCQQKKALASACVCVVSGSVSCGIYRDRYTVYTPSLCVGVSVLSTGYKLLFFCEGVFLYFSFR